MTHSALDVTPGRLVGEPARRTQNDFSLRFGLGRGLQFILLPERNLGIVMLANIDGSVPVNLQHAVLKTLLPNWAESAA